MSNQTHSLAISTPSVSWLNLVRLSLVLTLAVIALGAYTRLSDAGLGCPDWPGCYGHYTVPLSPSALQKAEFLYPHLDVEPHKAWPEMIHRYFAGTLGLVVFSITYLCLRYRPIPMTLPLMIAAIVLFQALLGMWTVTLKLLPLVVMGHLIGGFQPAELFVAAVLAPEGGSINVSFPRLSTDQPAPARHDFTRGRGYPNHARRLDVI